MATSLVKADLFGWQHEPDERAPIRATQAGAEHFTATGAGSTTTTVSAALTGATNVFYVGRLLVCVSATNAANIDEVAEVTAFNAATDTLTHTLFPAATSSGDQFALLDPPDPIVVETTGTSGLQVDSTSAGAANRNEADATYAGDYLVAVATTNNAAGTALLVNTFTSASGRFAVTAVGSTVIGDYWLVRRFPKLWGPPDLAFRVEDIARETQTGALGDDQEAKGSRSWSATCTLPLKGPGTAGGAGDGVAALPPPELHMPLKAIFATKVSTGEAVQAGSTTTVVQVTDTTASQFPVGSLVMDSAGVAAVVTATAADGANPDDITVNPPLSRAPASGEVLYGGYSYEPQLTGHKTLTISAWKDVVEWRGYGGLPTVEVVDLQRNAIPKIRLGYSGNYWLTIPRAKPAALVGTFDSVVPTAAGADCRATLCESGSTTAVNLVVESCSIDYGHQVAQEDAYSLPDAIYGGRITWSMPVATLTMKLDNASPNLSYDEIRRYYSSRVFALKIQHGSRRGRTVVWYAHRCVWRAPEWPQADGLQKITMRAHVLRSELTNMPICLLGFC